MRQDGLPDNRYTNLIVQLNDLENINKIHMHYIDWLRSNGSIIRLPTLFSEIFDIPISSKSSTSSAISESICDESLVNDIGESDIVLQVKNISDMSEQTKDNNPDNRGKSTKTDVMNTLTSEIEFQLNTTGEGDQQLTSADRQINMIDGNQSLVAEYEQQSEQDFFLNLTNFQDTDERIDAADLNPTMGCLDAIEPFCD